MSFSRCLNGSCSCGRNRYTVHIPAESTQIAQVIFDNSRVHRRSQATPLSAWLRVPLSWYQSTTYAFMDDETHSAIRRAYTSPHEENSKRHFCGFCGTPLSYWSENPASEAEFISLTLGSLAGKDLRDLEDLGLLPADALEDVVDEKDQVAVYVEEGEGLPWFEKLVEGSKLGKMRKSWGERRSGNGRYKIEWEIVEWTDDDEAAAEAIHGKRKIGELVEDADTRMQH